MPRLFRKKEGKYKTNELVKLKDKCYLIKERNPMQEGLSCTYLCSLHYKCWSRRDKREELEGSSCEDLIGDNRFFKEFKDGI